MRRTLWCTVWEITLKCDLRCIHCGASAGKCRENELDTREALALADSLKKAGAKGVALMGGEPLLRGDWAQIARRVRDNGMELSVITNGAAGTDGDVATLKSLSPRAVAVSIDAADPEIHDLIRGVPGAWRKSWNFLLKCRDAGLPVTAITAVHKKNLSQLGPLRDLLRGKNIAWQIQTAGAEGSRFPQGLMLDEEEFYSVGLFIGGVKKSCSNAELPVIGAHDLGYHSFILPELGLGGWKGCQAGLSVLGIQSDGGVKGCLALNGEPPEANVRQTPLEQIWESPDYFACNRNFNMLELGDNCRNCENRFSCRGGCGEMSALLTGKKHNDPYCFRAIEQKLFPEKTGNPLWRLWRRLLK
ncbi:MAG: radical SAM protein [Elusimicrobiales bacterium]